MNHSYDLSISTSIRYEHSQYSSVESYLLEGLEDWFSQSLFSLAFWVETGGIPVKIRPEQAYLSVSHERDFPWEKSKFNLGWLRSGAFIYSMYVHIWMNLNPAVRSAVFAMIVQLLNQTKTSFKCPWELCMCLVSISWWECDTIRLQ